MFDSLCLCHFLSLTFSFSLSLSHTHFLSLSLSSTHAHAHSLSYSSSASLLQNPPWMWQLLSLPGKKSTKRWKHPSSSMVRSYSLLKLHLNFKEIELTPFLQCLNRFLFCSHVVFFLLEVFNWCENSYEWCIKYLITLKCSNLIYWFASYHGKIFNFYFFFFCIFLICLPSSYFSP